MSAQGFPLVMAVQQSGEKKKIVDQMAIDQLVICFLLFCGTIYNEN